MSKLERPDIWPEDVVGGQGWPGPVEQMAVAWLDALTLRWPYKESVKDARGYWNHG